LTKYFSEHLMSLKMQTNYKGRTTNSQQGVWRYGGFTNKS